MTPPEDLYESGDPSSHREDAAMEATRSIADSSLTASSALEVYRVALSRITPMVGATFSSIFLRDEEDAGLLRLACAQNWPQSSARFLAELRIRAGLGPTGRAVESGEPVEIVDLFDDPSLQHWWEAAREIGFTSITALPLAVDGTVLGAISFYFRDRQEPDDDVRKLLGVVAHQLAITAERAGGGRHGSSGLELERQIEALRLTITGMDES